MSARLEIVPVTPADGAELARLLTEARPEYVFGFHPFPFTTAAIEKILCSIDKDRWWALRADGALAGFLFLRGFDEGYERPSFGVFVAEAFAGQGFARAALQHALDWSRRHSIAAVMLKVHPEHERARAIYERAGFRAIGVCPQTGYQMMEAHPLAERTCLTTAPAK